MRELAPHVDLRLARLPISSCWLFSECPTWGKRGSERWRSCDGASAAAAGEPCVRSWRGPSARAVTWEHEWPRAPKRLGAASWSLSPGAKRSRFRL